MKVRFWIQKSFHFLWRILPSYAIWPIYRWAITSISVKGGVLLISQKQPNQFPYILNYSTNALTKLIREKCPAAMDKR